MNQLPPVLLLDLDDTIVAFSQNPRDFWREACEAHAGRLGELGEPEKVVLEALLHAIKEVSAPRFWADPKRAAQGRLNLIWSRREVVKRAFEHLGVGGRSPEVEVAIADHFSRTKAAAVHPFPGAVEALREFHRRGMRLALVSNGGGPDQRAKLNRYDLTGFFQAIVIEGEWGVGKPDPSGFLEALRQLEATPSQAWMVGDNLVADIQGAQAVGIKAVWIDHRGKGLPADHPIRPDRTIRHLAQLLEQSRGAPSGPVQNGTRGAGGPGAEGGHRRDLGCEAG